MSDRLTLQSVTSLVTASPAFSPAEALEWLQLLPLMNDQQLLETQRILSAIASDPGKFKSLVLSTPVIASAPNSKPDTATLVRPELKIQRKGVAEHQIQKLEDLTTITPDHLRAWGEEGLFTAIKAITQEYGWPVARLEFEESPLFVAYVDAGRKNLGDPSIVSGDLLEAHEFEAVADLLHRLALAGGGT